MDSTLSMPMPARIGGCSPHGLVICPLLPGSFVPPELRVTKARNSPQQFGGGLVLFDERACAEQGGAGARGRVAMTTEHQHRGGECKLRDQGQAVFAVQVSVEHHHIGVQPCHGIQSLGSAGGSAHAMKCNRCAGDQSGHPFAHGPLVIDHKHTDRRSAAAGFNGKTEQMRHSGC